VDHYRRSMITMYIGVAIMMGIAYLMITQLGCAGSGTTGVDPSALESRFPGMARSANDMQTRTYGHQIQQAIESYRSTTGALPSVADVSATGALAEYLPDWPASPFTNAPMVNGSEPGDYRYEITSTGDYSLVLVLSTGEQTLH
jgi:hypothetical protein